MIGHRHHGETGGGRLLDDLARREPPVGRGGMEVEIDPLDHARAVRPLSEVDGSPRAHARCGRCRRRAGRGPALDERAVLANQQLEMLALLFGELEEDLLASPSPRTARRSA